jgi:septal ring factor EnvC (AmiA/AmiB activator)
MQAVIGIGVALTMGIIYMTLRRSKHENSVLSLIHENQLKIMATQAELAAQLTTLGTQVQKIGQETSTLVQKVADLEEALNNQDDVSPELQAAFDGLKSQVQVVDDQVADTVIPPTEEPTEPQV